jgi:hypothetical protein
LQIGGLAGTSEHFYTVISKVFQRVKANVFSGDLEQRVGMRMRKVINFRNSRSDALLLVDRSNDWLGVPYHTLSRAFIRSRASRDRPVVSFVDLSTILSDLLSSLNCSN